MIPYLVGPDREALTHNRGTIIMASSPVEAAEKYHVIDGVVGYESKEGFMASVWVYAPDGTMTEIEAEPDEVILGYFADDDGEVTCPKCHHTFLPA